MGIIAAGQITVVDLSDAPVLNTFITASRPTTQTYSKDSRTYKPSYASTPQVLTLKVTKAGSTANIIDSISSLHWFVVDGPIKTEITSKDNRANEYISGTHNEILTTKLDIDLNKGSKRYEVMGIWPDPSTGLDVQFGGYIDLLLTQNGATGPQGPQGDTGNGIANTVITYGLSMSDTTEPATWSSEMPTLVKGMYLWTRTVIIYTNGSSTTSYQISYIAKDADATAEIDKAKQELLEKLETVRDDSLEAVEEAKQQLVTVRDESLAAAEEAKQGLINVNTKVDNAKKEIDKAKQDLTNVASELNTAKQDLADSVTAANTKVDNTKAELTQAKQDLVNVASELNTAKQNLTDSVTAVNTKVDNAKEELTQAKQQLTTVADDLSTAKQDFQNAVSAVDTKATNLKSDLAQAKQDLASQAHRLQEQASAQSELTNRVSSVEETANGTKTTVRELSKTVAQNGKDITSVTARTKVVEDDLSGTKTTLSQVKTTADSASQKTATLETGLNGLSAKFSNLRVGGHNYLRGTSDKYRTLTSDNYLLGYTGNKNISFLDLLQPLKGETVTIRSYIKNDTDFPVRIQVWFTGGGVNGNPVPAHSEGWSVGTGKILESFAACNVAFVQTGNGTNNGGTIQHKEDKLEKGNIPTDYSPNEADLEQKVAEYKQNADQNYASLQSTVQNLDGTVQHNKTVAEQTAAGFKTRIESLETYKDGETTRANQYFESARTETARQLSVERTAIAKDYVAKSTYTSDVTGIRNELSATTSTANTTKTNLANYQASNDRAVANLQSNLQTANGNISSLKTKVEAVPGQITSAVSAVESKIPTNLDSLNLMTGTRDWSTKANPWHMGANWSTEREEYQGLKVHSTQKGFNGSHQNIFVKNGDVITFSFFAKATNTLSKIKVSSCWNGSSVYQAPLAGVQERDEQITVTSEWKRYSKTVHITSDGSLQFRTEYDGATIPNGNTFYVAGLKLAKTSQDTGYSENPTDVASDITKLSSEIKQTADGITLLATKTELNNAKGELQSGITTATNKANSAQSTANNNAQTISTHTTQISALNTGLQAKVSQSDFNTLSGRVTTAENNITAKANELSSKITSVEGKIPTTVGGRNYLHGTSDKYQTYTSTNYILGFPSTYRDWSKLLDPLRGKTVTLRAYIKNDTDYPVRIQLWANIGGVYGSVIPAHSEGWSVGTGKFSADWTSANVAFVQAGNGTNNGGTIQAKEAKLEIGNIPTDWSPAPEDAISQINAVSSELKQTKDGITLLATKTELNTAKNELQSGISTATNKANSAQNKANSNAQTISTHTTQISALNTGLSAKVSQTDFNTLSGRVTNAENNITAKANELSSKITSVEGKIPTTVGGRNYLHGTSDKYKTYTSSNYLLGYANSGGTWNDMLNPLRGKTVTLRAYIKNDTNFPVRIQIWTNAGGVNGNSVAPHSEGWSVGTGKMLSDWVNANVAFVQTGNGTNNGGTIQAKEAKLEIGNIPSDWSPAPEDTQSDITKLSSEVKQTADGMTLLATKTELNTAKNELQSGVTTATNKANAAQNTANNNAQTISTHTTQISALNTGLQAKVSQTDFNTLSGRVTTAENNITAKANELSSKITSVEGKIPTSIGARNYIRNYGLTATGWTSHKSGWSFEIIKDSTAKSGQYLKATCTTVNTGISGFYKNLFDFSDGHFFGKQMTWSMDVKTSKNTKLTIGCEWGNAVSDVNTTTNWQRFSKTFKVATSSNQKMWIFYSSNWNVGDIVYIRDVQLEDGSIATTPVPAIEDTESDITKLSSELTQTKDGITLLATKTELNTAKNELQSGINTATNKANSNAQTISTHTTQISALNSGLSAKVSQSDFNKLSGRVTTAENNITAKANELSSKITSVEGKIPTTVGGRNYLHGTSDKYQTYTSTDYILGFPTTYRDWPKLLDPLRGKTVTLRAYIKNDTDFPVRIQLWANNGGVYGNVIPAHSEGWSVGTGKMSSDWTSANVAFIQAGNGANNGGTIKAKEAKLEIGNIPTDWSPAPEDTISQINAVSSELKQTKDGITLLATKTELNNAKNELQSGINTATNKANSNAQTISTHTTQISALNSGLSAKVSQTDFNTLSGRVTNAENNITAKANELSSKITSVEGKIPTTVGGRNYIRNYGLTATGWNNTTAGWKFEIISDSTAKSGQYLKATCTTASTRGGGFHKKLFDFSDGRFFGKKMTWSMDVKLSKAKSVKIGPEWGYAYLDTNATTEWKRYSKTFTVATTTEYNSWIFYTNDSVWNVGDIVYIRDVQLEDGSIATSPVPAIEDTASDITKLSSELTQTKDGITLLATKTELNTAKNDLQSGINTATNKANAAQNTANSAQNKANSNAQAISTHTTQISALNTGLSAKVSQTDFNTLSGRVTNAENNITAKANELSSKITSVEGKIPTTVGGRNYALKTGESKSSSNSGFKLYDLSSGFDGIANNATLIIEFDWSVTAPTSTSKFRINRVIKYSDGTAEQWDNMIQLNGGDVATAGRSGHYSGTFKKIKYNSKAVSSRYLHLNQSTASGTVTISNLSVRVGSLKSDWQPAPEDAISQISSLSSELKQTKDGITLLATKTELNTAKNDLQSGINTATNKANAAQNTANSAQNKANSNAQTISTHTTQISALNTGLQAKVSQTDFNTLSGRVTTAENNITAKANELSSKITSVEGKIPTTVGGRNYIRNYGLTATGWTQSTSGWKFEIISDSTAKSGQYLKATCTKAGRNGFYKNLFDFSDGRFFGKQMTWSMDVKLSKAKSVKIGPEWGYAYLNTNATTEWKRYSKTFTVATTTEFKQWIIYTNDNDWNVGDIVYIRDVQLEDGSIVTSPVPAIEDTKSDINAVSSELKQTTDAIKASVTSLDKSTVKSSSLTINSDGIVMKAGKSTTDVANAIGSYFAVNQNAIDLFADKIKVKGNMIVAGSLTADMISGGQLRSTNGATVFNLNAGTLIFNNNYGYIQRVAGDKIFEITTYLGKSLGDSQDFLTSDFTIRKSDNSRRAGVQFQLYNTLDNKPTATAKLNADSLTLYDSKNTRLFSVDGKSAYMGGFNMQGWGDIPVAQIHGGLVVKDIGIGGHMKSLLKIVEELCQKAGIMWI